jgi:hypothetical protein
MTSLTPPVNDTGAPQNNHPQQQEEKQYGSCSAHIHHAGESLWYPLDKWPKALTPVLDPGVETTMSSNMTHKLVCSLK